MATLLSNNQVRLNDGTVKSVKQGEWYDGQHYFNGSLGAVGVVNDPNAVGYNNRVSDTVVAQTNPNNVSYLNNTIKASQLQAPVSVPYTTNTSSSFVSGLNAQVEQARKALDANLSTRLDANKQQMTALRATEQETLGKVKELTTPFRADLETQQRESLYINKNFEDNQKLVDELDQLLTEGNNLITQQQEVTGLAAIRNPRIQKTMNDVAARAGVIQAVMAARNSQISQAYTMIDRTVGAITQDRNDQLNYYNTILNLTNRDIMSLDADSKQIAQEQVNLLKNDLGQAQETANYVKQMMLDPAKAQLLADAGVTLNDSVEAINGKLAQATYVQEVREVTNEYASQGGIPITNPSGVSTKQLRTYTDSKGVVHYYKLPAPAATPENQAKTFNSSTPIKPDSVGNTSAAPAPITQVQVNSLWNSILSSPQGGSATLK